MLSFSVQIQISIVPIITHSFFFFELCGIDQSNLSATLKDAGFGHQFWRRQGAFFEFLDVDMDGL